MVTAQAFQISYKPGDLELGSIANIAKNTFAPVSVIENDDETPLSTLWNSLVRESKADVVILLNDDVFAMPLWDVPVVRAFANPTVAVAGPGANSGPQTIDVGNPPMVPPTDEWLASVPRNIPESNAAYKDREIFGFAYALRRSVWLDVGGFDETIPFYGNEKEFNARVRTAGFRVVKVYGSYVFHVGGKTRRRPRSDWAVSLGS